MKHRQTLIRTIIILASGLFVSQAANAQTYQQTYQQDYITIFEDCNYSGDRRTLSVGEYNNMRSIDFGNDRMSSIRVPSGFSVTIFEDDDYRGDKARIVRDISCFDRQWNDRVSSLSVDSENARSYQQRPTYDSNGRLIERSRVRNPRIDNRNVGNRNGGNPRIANQGGRIAANTTGRNVARVVFGNQILQQTNLTDWQMIDGRTGSTFQLKEVSRDDNTVLLQNQFTAQRVRIDLFARDVTVVDRNSQPQRFGITTAQPSLLNTQPNVQPNAPVSNTANPSRRLNGPCFNYNAYSRGGTAGVRFHGQEGFNTFGSKALSGRVCGDKVVTMEINKMDQATDVLIEIQGRTFRFAPNEEADAFRNTWYRKLVRLVLE